MPAVHIGRAMTEESKTVVYAALAGNILVALSKFGAAFVSGSSALLTEAIHSTADTANQVLLLVGNKRSRRHKDKSHAFGYGMEMYFWTFVVAVIVFLAGGVTSIWEGAQRIASPVPLSSPRIILGVLALSAVFEGSSFAVAYRAYKRRVRGRNVLGRPVGLWRFIGLSKDPNLYESLLEDCAALLGIGLATGGVVASVYFGALWADGAASIAIGVLLIGCSAVIAEATRSLMAGETVAPPVLEDIQKVLRSYANRLSVSEVKTLHLGPEKILVALTVQLASNTLINSENDLTDVSKSIQSLDKRITYVYFRLG
jgi:cation diffusion facilitator family transporter